MLLVDVGNTRLKWAVTQGDAIGPIMTAVHEGHPEDVLGKIACDMPKEIRISSVMGEAQASHLGNACLARWNILPRFARSQQEAHGLTNGYTDPGRLGVDRWLVMLAAWTSTRGACVVVDAGTALTVDVVDDSGQHLGGIIAAGLRASRGAVLGHTRFPVASEHHEPHAGLGTDTESCVAQGAVLSCLGAIHQASSLTPGARKFICGGDAKQLLPLIGPGWEHRETLVLEGLRAAS